ncbi:MAG: hypothetical protein Q8P15_00060 [Nanoarchaeota archaeon]|nr:hypothetical protein [Nanoarchaeota archaeon]
MSEKDSQQELIALVSKRISIANSLDNLIKQFENINNEVHDTLSVDSESSEINGGSLDLLRLEVKESLGDYRDSVLELYREKEKRFEKKYKKQ